MSGNRHYTEWTDERNEQLKLLIERGLTCSQIAVEMDCGFTRNAISGRIHRLGLHRPDKPRPSSKPRERKIITIEPGGHGKHRVRESVASIEQHKPHCVEIECTVPLLDLADDQCHYIAGDNHLYCGGPKMPGSPLSYCTQHYHAMWMSPIKTWARAA